MNYCERVGIHPSICEIIVSLEDTVQIATALVQLCHIGADQKLRRDQAIKWWTSFLPERIMLSAMTSATLGEFCAELCGRLNGRIGGTNDQGGELQRIAWAEIVSISPAMQKRVLDILEAQAVVCATLVRASADAFREETRLHDESIDEERTDKAEAVFADRGLFPSIAE